MGEIANGNDAFGFLSRFPFWSMTKSSNGRLEVVINLDGKYLKVWSRKDEPFVEAVDRLRQKADDECTP